MHAKRSGERMQSMRTEKKGAEKDQRKKRAYHPDICAAWQSAHTKRGKWDRLVWAHVNGPGSERTCTE